MKRKILKSKIVGARVTKKSIFAEDSIIIDEDLLEEADIREYELVTISNTTRDTKFSIYATAGKRGSGMIAVNGYSENLVKAGDLITITSEAFLSDKELDSLEYTPKIVFVDVNNFKL